MNLKELSEKLGLSQTTVSRALNGYPEVGAATRRRVEEAANAHNYIPSSRARRLATGRSMTIGHVIPVSTKHEMVNPIFTDFIAGAGEAYSEAGYDLTLSLVSDQDIDSVYREITRRGSVDGVIVHGPKADDHRIGLLRELKIPFVVHGRASAGDQSYNWVDVNNRRAFFRATGLLLDLGHLDIALINGVPDMDFSIRRRDGFLNALQERGLTHRAELMAHGEMTEPHGYKNAREMLACAKPPTAFLVSSVISAFGVRRAIAERGLEVGRDVSVVIFDDDLSYFRNDNDVPVYTAVKSSVREAGRLAGTMLLDIIHGKREAPVYHLLEADLTIGQSTGPAPASRS